MKHILLIMILLGIMSCKDETPKDQLKKEILESIQMMQSKDMTAKLTSENITSVTDSIELKSICEQIMNPVGKGEIKKAFDEMKKYTFLPEKEMDGVYTKTKNQLKLTKNRFGKAIGHEFISPYYYKNGFHFNV